MAIYLQYFNTEFSLIDSFMKIGEYEIANRYSRRDGIIVTRGSNEKLIEHLNKLTQIYCIVQDIMQAKRSKMVPSVHIFTQKTDMKFIPEFYQAIPSSKIEVNNLGYVNKFKSLFGFSKYVPSNESKQVQTSTSKQTSQQSQISQSRAVQKQVPGKSQQEPATQKQAPGKSSQSQVAQKQVPGKSQQEPATQKQAPGKSSQSQIAQKQTVGKSSQDRTAQKQVTAKQQMIINKASLKFVQKISPEFIMVGNEHQLDLINISNITSQNYVDTDYYWSLKFQQKISSIAVDSKKMNVLAIIVNKTLKIYKYDHKNILTTPFNIFKEEQLQEQPFFMSMGKDGNICVFYQTQFQIYTVSDTVDKREAEKYSIFDLYPDQTFEILTVPDSYENSLSVFFAEKLEGKKIFALWGIEIEFQALNIKVGQPKKIYEIKNALKQTMTLTPYNREIFILNLRSEINAVKAGYVLDSASIRMNPGQEFLKYMGNGKLYHIGKKMVEVYNFELNMQVKPNRIKIQAVDSIKIYDDMDDYKFVKSLPILNDQLLIVFQIKPSLNNNKNGEVRYCFFISQSITRQEKINRIFPRQNWKIKLDSDDLNQRCDIARKMGMTDKQIYLQLWNRTQMCQKQDYNILILTNDYQTIRNQILRKLKKASMSFKEIQKIQKDCFEILQGRVFSPQCTEDAVMEYISCHFFLRKLQMFKDEQLLERQLKSLSGSQVEGEEDKIIKITIRQYQNLKALEIRSDLMEQIDLFCEEKSQKAIKKIRFLLRNFKFVFRIIYYEVLEEIIKKTQSKLFDVISAIPQLLPYVYEPDSDPSINYPLQFFEGVWPAINARQWKQSLFVDAITTIDNKQIVLDKVIKSLSFRRNFLSQHDLVTITKKQIESNAQKINSSETFYFFIAKMFRNIKDEEVKKKVIDFLENTPNYTQMPGNLKDKIFLIYRLYNFLSEEKLLPKIKGQDCTLYQFLKFKDEEFMRHFFVEQRSKKGLILKNIKPMYHEVCGKQKGAHLFNQALLNYFISDLSQISDLKYILNRINNQRKQFHLQNQKMYEILVEALERKLKIGTDKDVPIQQVMIYIENIPLKGDQNGDTSKAMMELALVESVKEQAETLQAAKLNMSIYEILHQQDDVITKLVSYCIKEKNILNPYYFQETPQKMKEVCALTYKIIAELQNISEEIYKTPNCKTIFFIYLTKLCEEKQMIKYACHLLQDEYLKNCYDETFGEGLARYMYHWVMVKNKIMLRNEIYVNQLLTLLEKDSVLLVYLQSQMQYAKILSDKQNPYEYPINQDPYTINHLRKQLLCFSVDFLMQIDLLKLHSVVQKIQKIHLESLMQCEDEQNQFQFTIANLISLHQVYEIVIIEILSAKKLKTVLPYIRKIMEQQINDPTYNIIYPILYIIELSNSITDENRNNLISCIFYYFYEPLKLLQIIEDLVTVSRNPKQMKYQIEYRLMNGKESSKGYNKDNSVFSQEFIELLNSKEDEELFMKKINEATKHMRDSKEEFKKIKYAAIMAMLCNSPYALAKLIVCSTEINVSAIRCFLSYAIQQDIFDPLAILELGRRIFLILLESQKNREAIEQVIERYTPISLLDQEIDAEYIFNQDDQEFRVLKMWWKSAEAFKKKKEKVIKDQEKKKKVEESLEVKSNRFKMSLEGKSSNNEPPKDYPFPDKDNEEEEIINIRDTVNLKKVNRLQFNEQQERNRVLEKKKNNLFHSTNPDMHKGGLGMLSTSIRGHKYNTDTHKPYYNSFKLKKTGSAKDEKEEDQALQEAQLVQSHHLYGFNDISEHRKARSQQSHSSVHSPSGMIIQAEHFLNTDQQNDDEDIQHEIKSHSAVSNPYVVKVKEVQEEDDLVQQVEEIGIQQIPQIKKIDSNMIEDKTEDKVEKTSQNIIVIPSQVLARILFEKNQSALETSKINFDFSQIQRISNNKQQLRKVVQDLYTTKPGQIKLIPVFKMIIEIAKTFPTAQLSETAFQTLISITEEQQKYIIDIPFDSLLPVDHLLDNFETKRDVFDVISGSLTKHTDSQNLYKVCLFVKRAFSSPELEGLVTWDFILNLCEKIDTCETQQTKMNLEKIQYTLAKVKLNVWNQKFDLFAQKVLNSNNKQNLLNIFCSYLSQAVPRSQAKTFLEKLSEIEQSEIVKSTLNQFF